MGWNPLDVIPGMLVFFFGLWFDFGVFVSGDPGIPISWQMFIIPLCINAIGIALIIFGLKRGSRVPPSKVSNA